MYLNVRPPNIKWDLLRYVLWRCTNIGRGTFFSNEPTVYVWASCCLGFGTIYIVMGYMHRTLTASVKFQQSNTAETHKPIDKSHSQAVSSFIQVHYKDGTDIIRVWGQMRDRDRERKTTNHSKGLEWGRDKQTNTHRTQCSFDTHTDSTHRLHSRANKQNQYVLNGKMHLLHMQTKLLNDAESKHIENWQNYTQRNLCICS